MNKLAQEIIKKIEKNKPLPKWRFVSLQVLGDVLLIFLWIVGVLLAGASVYIIRHYNPWENLPSGFKYFWSGFLALPWELIIFLLALLVLIYCVSRKIHFIYRFSPWLILTVIFFSLLGGYCLAESIGVNQGVAEHPVAKEIYRQQGRLIVPNRGSILVGEIKQIQANKLIITDQNNRTWIIAITRRTAFPTGQNLVLGGKVVIVGLRMQDIIDSAAVRILDANWRGSFNLLHLHNLFS